MQDHGGRSLPLGLDAKGQRLYDEWKAHADPQELSRVDELLFEVRWQHNWKTIYGANQDPFERWAWIVYIHDNLVVVIREFSNENDPQNEFSLWIGPPPVIEGQSDPSN